MSSIQENNKRIVRNTFVLYSRMFLLLAVSLYTSRVVLQTLGVEDFGIYNVVAGVVSFIGIFNGAMGSATSRYITYELGKGDKEQLHKTFCTCFEIYVLLGIVFTIFAETIGLWFLNTQMVIPKERMFAANCIYQFTILSVINTFLVNPYNACIISHEKMDIYAYLSIIEALFKLAIIYILWIVPYDRLVTYGLLNLLMSLVVTMIYRLYCINKFEECHLKIYKDYKLFRKLISFSGWTLWGAMAVMTKGQGLNILLNIFFNPAVNASRGIAYQINMNIIKFGDNFYTAVRPQITKYYAQGDLTDMFNLVFRSSKLTYYLLLFISLPILIETPFIINLWLGQLPEYVVDFTRLIIIISVVDCMAAPIMTTANATGNIKLYQILMGLITISNIPISYILLKNGANPVCVFYVSLILACICYVTRVCIVKYLIPKFPILKFLQQVTGIIVITTIAASIVPLLLHNILSNNVINMVIVCLSALVSTIFAIYFVGMNKAEKAFAMKLILKRIKK